ncbi:MAG TPA: UDP-N-acetylglucosamine 2-epimerase [Aggregatilineaceae bacterium]|nr:UDP-N-acetylglucosamine 2-epimerase [Aggregatilineaceae bacterium]
MTRLVIFSEKSALDGFDLDTSDILVPLNDKAQMMSQEHAKQFAVVPEWGVLQAEALYESLSISKGVLRALNADAEWQRLLWYKEYDLRPMALKNLYLGLENTMQIYRLAKHVVENYPRYDAVLLDSNPETQRIIQAIVPQVKIEVSARLNKARWRELARPVGRFARDRWQIVRSKRPAKTNGAPPVLCFLDAPHRARLMARTLTLLSKDYPIHNAWLDGPWEWPENLAIKPAASYPWYACTPGGAWRRITRHVLGSRAQTELAAFDLPAWLPPNLLWALRYADVQRYANLLEAFEGLAQAKKPLLWITVEDVYAFGKAVAAVGERYQIPTINVQHGVLGPYRTAEDVSGVYAVFGEDDRQKLIERGADPKRIVVTGPVRYDDILELKLDRTAFLRGAKLDPSRPLVMFSSQPIVRLLTEENKHSALMALLNAAKAIGAQVVIKAHPLEDRGMLERLVAESGYPALIVWDQLYEWLKACDVMATICSTTVYEAALADRPVLLLDWSENPITVEYLEQGIGVLPKSPDQTEETLWQLLTDKAVQSKLANAQQEFVLRNLAGSDGKASERLAKLARQLIEEKEVVSD